jgi:hypothetical protein
VNAGANCDRYHCDQSSWGSRTQNIMKSNVAFAVFMCLLTLNVRKVSVFMCLLTLNVRKVSVFMCLLTLNVRKVSVFFFPSSSFKVCSTVKSVRFRHHPRHVALAAS